MMYGCVCDELKAMKEGLNDIIPPELLSGLTAEVAVVFVVVILLLHAGNLRHSVIHDSNFCFVLCTYQGHLYK